MSDITFTDAVRKDVDLLILLAGGTGSGKTESGMRLATGLSGEEKFAVIDTENGRALHKADDYKFKHYELQPPFTAERYADAVKAADAQGFPVIVIDSGSHVYEGEGGLLDQQAEEFARLGGQEKNRMASWVAPKQRHKRFVQTMLRAKAHVILCLRAEDKIEVVKVDGKTVVRPRESLTGAQGWIPICEKRLPFEATVSLLLTADAPGVAKPIKVERSLPGRPPRAGDFIPLDRELDESVGRDLAAWAAGVSEPEAPGKGGAVTPTGERSAERSEPVSGSATAARKELKVWIKENNVSSEDAQKVSADLFPGVAAGDLSAEQAGRVREVLTGRLVGAEA